MGISAGNKAKAVPEVLQVQRIICLWEFLPVQNPPHLPYTPSTGEGLESHAKSSLSFLCNRPFLLVDWKQYQTWLTKRACTATCICLFTGQLLKWGIPPHKSTSALHCSNTFSLLGAPVEKVLPHPDCFVLPPLCRSEEMCANPAGQIPVSVGCQEWHLKRQGPAPHLIPSKGTSRLFTGLLVHVTSKADPAFPPSWARTSSDNQVSYCLHRKAPLEGVRYLRLSAGSWKSEVMRCDHQQSTQWFEDQQTWMC